MDYKNEGTNQRKYPKGPSFVKRTLPPESPESKSVKETGDESSLNGIKNTKSHLEFLGQLKEEAQVENQQYQDFESTHDPKSKPIQE